VRRFLSNYFDLLLPHLGDIRQGTVFDRLFFFVGLFVVLIVSYVTGKQLEL